MPTVKNANGEWVKVADDVSPERLAQITGGALPENTPLQVNIPNPRAVRRREEVLKRADEAGKSSMPTVQDTVRGAARGLTMNFSDELAGVAGALTGGDYETSRDTERELIRRAEQRSPIASTVGEIGGAIVNPIGIVGKAKAVGTGASLLAKAANALRGPVGAAAATGATQGALNAIGSAEDMANVPAAAGEGALIGGGTGGVMGGAIKFGSKAINAIKDRAPEAAERMAYTKAGERVRQAGKTPQEVEAELANANANSNDMRFMDVTPGTRSDAAYYGRRPNLNVSNDLQQEVENRMTTRGERFTDKIEQVSKSPVAGQNTDSDALLETIVKDRKATGAADYAVGGVMDAPVRWSKALDEFWANAPEDTLAAMRAARREVEGRRGDPDAYFIQHPSTANTATLSTSTGTVRTAVPPSRSPQGINAKGEPATPGSTPGMGTTSQVTVNNPVKFIPKPGSVTVVPTLRAFDYMKRGFQSEIGAARKAGDEPKVQRLQSELGQFKALFAEANKGDKYAEVLLRQRTAFEREEAVKKGQQVLSRIGGGRQQAREELKRIQNLKPHEVEDYRTAILDGLLGLDAKANPLGVFRSYTRNEKQRQIMEFAFGGRKQLDEFTTYLNRELKSQAADTAVKGPPSVGGAHLVSDQLDDEVGLAANQVFRGALTAGIGGALSNAYRGMSNLSRGMGKEAQEKYGSVLMGDGTDLARKVGESDEFFARRQARAVRRAKMAAKGGQQVFTDQLGKQ